MFLLGAVLAIGVGVLLGLLGGGGSLLTVPVFVYAFGLDAKQAIALSLPAVGITALIAAFGHWRQGNIDLGLAARFGALTMGSAFAGARLAAFLSADAQMILFALTALFSALAMLRKSNVRAGQAVRPLALAVAGIAVGLLTGIVGVGGGFLIVPALVLLGGVAMHRAVGTSLIVIALNSIAGTLGYIGAVAVPWLLLLLFVTLAALGSWFGARLTGSISPLLLRRSFSVVLLSVAALILLKSL